MIRFVQSALLAATLATLGGCSDHVADLERARGERAPAGAALTSPSAQLPGLPTTPAAATTTPPALPGTPGAGTPGTQLTCPPVQVAAAASAWRPPSQPRAACTQQEGAAIVQCAFGNQNCNVPSATCRACAVSPKSTSSFYGPIIVDEATGGVALNVEGCAALLTGNINANGCGGLLQARFECEEKACAQCTTDTDRAACMQAADTGVCATQVQAANQCMPYAQQCMNGADASTIAFNLVGMFCGG